MSTPADPHAAAAELRARGSTVREIARILGVGRSTVDSWLNDPDGAKQRARRERYRGVCGICGEPTDGSNGRAAAPALCWGCYSRTRTVWTREMVRDAIQAWARIYGEPPASTDWNPRLLRGEHRRIAVERHQAGAWPGTTTVVACFGSWNEAIRAAGFAPRRIGHRRPTRWKV